MTEVITEEAENWEQVGPLCRRLVAELTRRGETIAIAESLTGGRLTGALVDVPGASAVLRGGIVAYASDLKASLLGVDQQLLATVGAVDAQVAAEMASGVQARLAATYGLATTGVAGPTDQDGHPPGTVHVALVGPRGARGAVLAIVGDRARVRSAAVLAALELLEGLVLDA